MPKKDTHLAKGTSTSTSVSLISEAIMAEATEKSNALHKQADDYKRQQLEAAESEVLSELYATIQGEVSQIQGGSVRDVARKENDMRKNLLLLREEITQRVFDAVKARVQEYSAGEAYGEVLIALAQQLAKDYPFANCVLHIRKADFQFSDELRGIFGTKCNVLIDDEMQLGGIRLMNQAIGIYVDESLDTKLDDMRPWFFSHSGLKVL